VGGPWISFEIYAGGHQTHSILTDTFQGPVAKESITGHDDICGPEHARETSPAALTAGPPRVERIAKENGIIEVKNQGPGCPADALELPMGEKTALYDH
jgi:hypothetical protein